jgi:N-acetylglutamate synthase-like GNAT family acetyltransferase
VFVTRATRHDASDIADLLTVHGSAVGEPSSGTFFVAREGAVVGCVRLWEVAPQVLVVRDVMVAAERRGEGVGAQLMQTAMNSRGGRLYLRCGEGEGPFFERLGFAAVEPAELPDAVVAHFDAHGPQSDSTTPMRAR